MKRSEQRILTTHTGSLPRPAALRDLLVRQDRGEAIDAAAFAREAEAAVRHVVARQLEAGIDVGNDGEQPRVGFSTYPARRMRGFGGASKRRLSRDIAEHPDYALRLSRQRAGAARINDAPLDGFVRAVALHIDAINEAIAGLPADRIRLHLCWGNYDGPHTHDVSLEPLLPIVYRAQVGALSLPLASPRHQHELRAFRRHPLPDGMLFVPGVIDSTTNVVEHPEVVADRIVAAAEAIGDRTRVLAGVDCGFGTFAGSHLVEESVVWTKLRALREGADLATRRLWK